MLSSRTQKRGRMKEESHTASGGKRKKQNGDFETTTDHFLVGNSYCLKWAGLDQTTKVIFGQVTACEVNSQTGEVHRVQVTYTPESRQLANSTKSSCGLTVPESQMLPLDLALGGCLECNKRSHSSSLSQDFPTKFHWTWINPDSRFREVIPNEDGKVLPKLSLIVRGFRLSLTVKPSNIPSAGNRVFLSCRPLASDSDKRKCFTLKAGELVDVGIQAPFLLQDVAENFVFNKKCEKWVIDALVSHFPFDTIDNGMAEMHEIATSHLAPSTDETDDDKFQTILTQHDPEGSVHFLVGHGAEDQGDFVLPADGSEVELFLNRGRTLAKERSHSAYSFMDKEGSNDGQEIDMEFIAQLNKCDCDVTEKIVEFLLATFVADQEASFETIVTERALICAAMIQRTVYHKLRDSGQDSQRLSLLLRNTGRTIDHLLSTTNEGSRIKKLQSESYMFDPNLVLWEVFRHCLPADLCLHLKDIIDHEDAKGDE